jgi:hypothetical protein
MKTRKIIIGITAIFSVVCLGDVSWARGRIGDRQPRQQARIQHGVKNGEITSKEYVRLKRERKKIRKVARKAWADDYLDYNERRRLQRMRDRASHHIYNAKHNPWKARQKWTKRHGPSRHRPYYDDYRCKPLKKHNQRKHHDKYIGSHLGGFIAEPGWLLAWAVGLD